MLPSLPLDCRQGLIENTQMLASPENLRDFNTFALERVAAGQAQSMRDLFATWLAMREQREVIEDMKASDADIAAGNVTPVHEALAEIRAKLGIEE